MLADERPRRRSAFFEIARDDPREVPGRHPRGADPRAARDRRWAQRRGPLQIFGELLARDPNNADAYNQIGYYYGYRGDYDKAIENLKKYQFMAPDQANPYDSLGEIQAFSGHYDEAIENLNKALALKPDFFESYDHLGVAYEGKGDVRRRSRTTCAPRRSAINRRRADRLPRCGRSASPPWRATCR